MQSAQPVFVEPAHEDNILSDVAAERAVLAGIYRYHHDGYVDVADLITPNTFTIESNQAWFRCLEHILQQGSDAVPDIPSLYSASKTLGFDEILNNEEERRHLRAITTMPVEQPNLRRLAGKIRKLEIARDGLTVAENIKDNLLSVTGDEPIQSILSFMSNPVTDFEMSLDSTGQGGPQLIGDGLDMWLAHLMSNPVTQMGIPSGLEIWDRAVGGGLRSGTINVFGARPKTGKTMLGIKIGRHVSKEVGVPVLYLDSEMSEDDHRVRNLAALSGVPMEDIETGRFIQDRKSLEAVENAAEILKSCKYNYMSIAGQPFEETLAAMRRWVTKTVGLNNGKANPCVIIFDYLKLMDAAELSKNVMETQVLGFRMTSLHNFAVRYGIPIVLFIQLNRDGIDVENSTAASGSDRIIWLCSNFTIFKKLSEEEMAEMTSLGQKFNRKFIITDCRHGPGSPDNSIYLTARLELARITEEVDRRHLERKQGGFSADTDKNIKF